MLNKLALIKAAPQPVALLADVRQMILAARESVARSVNASLVILYWQIGQRVRKDILQDMRAEYGEQIVHALSEQLTGEFGRGFTRTNMFNMIRFAETFPDAKIVHALSGQLSWTHLRQIIYLDEPLKRDFYAEMCRIERWNTRTLGKKSARCCLNEPRFPANPPNSARWNSKNCARRTSSRPTWFFAILTFSTSFNSKTPTRKKTSKPPSCARWKHSSSNLASASLSSNGKSGCRLGTRIITSTCFFITANFGVSSRLISSWKNLWLPTKARWNFTSTGSRNMSNLPTKPNLSALFFAPEKTPSTSNCSNLRKAASTFPAIGPTCFQRNN